MLVEVVPSVDILARVGFEREQHLAGELYAGRTVGRDYGAVGDGLPLDETFGVGIAFAAPQAELVGS